MEFYCDVDWLNGLLCRIHWYGLYGWGFMNVVGLLDSSLMWCVNVCFDFDCMSAWSCNGDGMVCSRFLVGCWSSIFGHDYGSLHFECGWSLLLVGMGLLI